MTITEKQLALVHSCRSTMARLSTEDKGAVLQAMARELRGGTEEILSANALDVEKAKDTIGAVMIDRLLLTAERIEAMAVGMEQVAELPDPVGRVLSTVTRPNAMVIEKTAVPMGVIAIIYESRPNVTSDAAALALMAGSACVLRSGKEAHGSATAIVKALQRGLASCAVPEQVLTLLEDTSRDSAKELMCAKGFVDLLIPRGGKGLISACVEEATVAVLETGTGICHGYVDKDADLQMAVKLIENAKASRPSVCNAMEVCLVHQDIEEEFLPLLAKALGEDRVARGLPAVELKLPFHYQQLLLGLPREERDMGSTLAQEDYETEFLDYILAVERVSSVDEAICHINGYSTGHSEMIVTENPVTAKQFTREVTSAAVYVNVSTRFTDGGEFGLGCEMGISTQKLHARGPLGLEELCTYQYVISGSGQIR